MLQKEASLNGGTRAFDLQRFFFSNVECDSRRSSHLQYLWNRAQSDRMFARDKKLPL
jgi:hypothetical protein